MVYLKRPGRGPGLRVHVCLSLVQESVEEKEGR